MNRLATTHLLAASLFAAIAWASPAIAQTESSDERPGAADEAASNNGARGAADLDPQTVERAKARYKQGAAAFAEAKYKDAIDLFLEANEIAPLPAFSYNIGLAYESMGDPPRALRWYRDYVRRSPPETDLGDAEKRIEALERQLQEKGVQQVTVLSEPEGVTVAIDGRPVGVTPWTGELMPGKHRATLTARGYEDTEQEFELLAHRSMDVRVALPEATRPRPTAGSEPSPPVASPTTASPADTGPIEAGPRVRWPTWATFGAAGATFGGGLAFELLRRSAEDDVTSAPTQREAAERIDTMESRQTTARVLVGVGGALAVAGGALLFIDLTRERGPVEEAKAGPGCVRGACGIVAKGRF